MEIIKKYGDTDFITGMRAYAALAVLFIHSGNGGIESLGEIGARLAVLGGQGVAVFFVISGYSVASSFASSQGFGDYINKRFWRIAPLYYFWIIIWLVAALLSGNLNTDAYNLFMHSVFLSSLDYRIAPIGLIGGVDWTLSIEMVWYFMVPSIFLWTRGVPRLIFCLIASTAIFVLITKFRGLFPFPPKEFAEIMHYSPIPYVFNFCLGIVAFKLREFSYNFARWGDVALISIAVAFLIFLLGPKSLMLHSMFVFFTIAAFFLILFGSETSKFYRILFSNRIVRFGGTISYGIYLCHISVIELIDSTGMAIFSNAQVKLAAVLTITTAISTVTYLLIEKPALAFGRFLFSSISLRRRYARVSVDQ